MQWKLYDIFAKTWDCIILGIENKPKNGNIFPERVDISIPLNGIRIIIRYNAKTFNLAIYTILFGVDSGKLGYLLLNLIVSLINTNNIRSNPVDLCIIYIDAFCSDGKSFKKNPINNIPMISRPINQ